MKAASPSEVTESVTMVVPGFELSAMTERAAMRSFLVRVFPSGRTAPALSTSVSKIIPRSALAFTVAFLIASAASLFSGLGM